MENNDDSRVAQALQGAMQLLQQLQEHREQREQIRQAEQMMEAMNLQAENNDYPDAAQQRQEEMEQNEQFQRQFFQIMEKLMNLLDANNPREKEVPQLEKPVADDGQVYSKKNSTDRGMAESGAASLMQLDVFMKDLVPIQVLASDAETKCGSSECSTSKSSDAEANCGSSECSVSKL